MTAEQWVQLKQLFEAALECDPPARDAFLARACGRNAELRAELDHLLLHYAMAGSFLEIPAAGSRARVFASEELVGGRFRILRFLGEGGMGEVYEAEDTELRERVALKTLRPEIAGQFRSIARLRQEILLARKVTHPNVCRVFDLARHSSQTGEVVLLTMELVEGETLGERLRRQGRLSTEEASPLAQQMANALDAAHHAGIIHRDFKSGNVMLAPGAGSEVRVVVTDFGLARTNEPGVDSPSLTGTGVLAGTPAYMAPEQLEGAEPTFASDVYAFGVVLSEMVTGRKPFDTLGGRLRDRPPSPRQYVPELDRRWEDVILQCLDPDPRRRFATAGDAVRALTRPRAPARLRWPTIGLRRIAMVTSVLALLALSWAGFRYYRWSRSIPEGSSVVLTEIENNTNDRELDAVTDLLRNQLEQSARFNVLERSRVRKILEQMGRNYELRLDAPVAREVALRGNSALVVFGGLTRLGAGYVLNLRVEQLGSRPSDVARNWDQSFSAEGRLQLFPAVQKAGDWVRSTAGEGAEAVRALNSAPAEATTSSWEALLAYSQAERLSAIGASEESLGLLHEATVTDPGFALAWMRLGDIASSLGRANEGYGYWAKALQARKGRGLTQREQVRVRGQYADEVEDFAGAERAFRSWEVLYPRDYLPSFYLAESWANLGRMTEALEKLRQAQSKEPKAAAVQAHLARMLIQMGKLDVAGPSIQQLRALGQPDRAQALEASVAFVRGDAARAEALLGELNRTDTGRSLGSEWLACLYAELGRRSQAIQVLAEGVTWDAGRKDNPGAARKRFALAYLRWRDGDQAGARRDALAGVALENGPHSILRAGVVLARAGFTKDALGLLPVLDSGLEGPIFERVKSRVRGEVLLYERKPAAALVEMRRAAVLAPAGEIKEYLARATAAAGNREAALKLYQQLSSSPALVWRQPDTEFPGIWTEAQAEYGRLMRAHERPISKIGGSQVLAQARRLQTTN